MTFTYLVKGSDYMPYEKLSNGQDHFVLGDMNIWVDETEFLMINGAALTEEPYMTALDDYRITIHFQCSEYVIFQWCPSVCFKYLGRNR